MKTTELLLKIEGMEPFSSYLKVMQIPQTAG